MTRTIIYQDITMVMDYKLNAKKYSEGNKLYKIQRELLKFSEYSNQIETVKAKKGIFQSLKQTLVGFFNSLHNKLIKFLYF